MLPAYWLSNYIYDIIKLMTLSVIAIIFVYIYGVSVDYGWLALLLYPFAAVPYTYVCSFIFPSEDTGEKFAMIHNFIIGGIVSIAVYVLRIISSTKVAGQVFFWLLKFLPMYCLCEAIVDSSGKTILETNYFKDNKTRDTLDMEVSGSAMLFLGLQAIGYTLLLVLIELNVFTFCFKYIKRSVSDPPRTDIIDEDVVNEMERVSTVHKNLAVRTFNL